MILPIAIEPLPALPVASVPPKMVVRTVREWLRSNCIARAFNTQVAVPPSEPIIPLEQTPPVTTTAADLSTGIHPHYFAVKYQLINEELIRVVTVCAPTAVEAFRAVVNFHADHEEIVRSMISIRKVDHHG
ncbi:MAG: hypothetical protein JNL32_01185 [Candidatus Kapabacteria bacterium]|nr:hypothetical protein [Candidatus Kapabacteria bacterium]